MPKIFKKFLLSFLSFLILFFSVAPNFITARAASSTPPKSTWYNTNFGDWYKKVYDEKTSPGNEIFGERYTAAQVQWVVYGVMSFILNAALGNSPDSQKVVSCMLASTVDLNTCGAAIKGLLSSAGSVTPVALKEQSSFMSLVFADRPLSGVSYVKHKLQNFTLTPVAKAETPGPGFGFTALEPIQSMWRGARDIAFGIFVLAAVVLSFMIMFRVKISPQVIITVQSAIPKLIIALILVTFSYAIAGFMVDLMYVVIGIVSLFGPSLMGVQIPPLTLFVFLTGVNIFLILDVYMFALIVSFIGSAAMMMGAPMFAVLGATMLVFLWWLILILLLVLIIVYIVVAIKTIWALLKAFAGFLLNVIFGPLQIVAGIIIPNFGFGAWLKSIAANLSVFVVTGVIMLLSFVFLINGVRFGLQDFFGGPTGAADLGHTFWNFLVGSVVVEAVNGNLTSSWPPLLGMGNSQAGLGMIFLGVSFVLFTLIPKATEIVQGFITGKPFAYGSAIGEAFGPVKAGVGYTAGTMEHKGELPPGVSNIYGAISGGKVLDPGIATAIGTTIQNYLRGSR